MNGLIMLLLAGVGFGAAALVRGPAGTPEWARVATVVAAGYGVWLLGGLIYAAVWTPGCVSDDCWTPFGLPPSPTLAEAINRSRPWVGLVLGLLVLLVLIQRWSRATRTSPPAPA